MRLSNLLPRVTVATSSSFASTNADDLCTAGGYYAGAQDRFLSGLATHVRVKKGILNDAKCSALWAHAYEVGAFVSRNGKLRHAEDAVVARKAAEFATRAYEAIHKNMELP